MIVLAAIVEIVGASKRTALALPITYMFGPVANPEEAVIELKVYPSVSDAADKEMMFDRIVLWHSRLLHFQLQQWLLRHG